MLLIYVGPILKLIGRPVLTAEARADGLIYATFSETCAHYVEQDEIVLAPEDLQETLMAAVSRIIAAQDDIGPDVFDILAAKSNKTRTEVKRTCFSVAYRPLPRGTTFFQACERALCES